MLDEWIKYTIWKAGYCVCELFLWDYFITVPVLLSQKVKVPETKTYEKGLKGGGGGGKGVLKLGQPEEIYLIAHIPKNLRNLEPACLPWNNVVSDMA